MNTSEKIKNRLYKIVEEKAWEFIQSSGRKPKVGEDDFIDDDELYELIVKQLLESFDYESEFDQVVNEWYKYDATANERKLLKANLWKQV